MTDTPEPTEREWWRAKASTWARRHTVALRDWVRHADSAEERARLTAEYIDGLLDDVVASYAAWRADVEAKQAEARSRHDETGDQQATHCGFVLVGIDACTAAIRALRTSPDTPESLEGLLDRARALGEQIGLEEINPGEWEACINIEQRGDRPGYLHTATGPTPAAALRALLEEGSNTDG